MCARAHARACVCESFARRLCAALSHACRQLRVLEDVARLSPLSSLSSLSLAENPLATASGYRVRQPALGCVDRR